MTEQDLVFKKEKEKEEKKFQVSGVTKQKHLRKRNLASIYLGRGKRRGKSVRVCVGEGGAVMVCLT